MYSKSELSTVSAEWQTLIQQFWLTLKVSGRSPRTLEAYELAARAFLAYLEEVGLKIGPADVTAEHVSKGMTRRGFPLAIRTWPEESAAACSAFLSMLGRSSLPINSNGSSGDQSLDDRLRITLGANLSAATCSRPAGHLDRRALSQRQRQTASQT